MVRFPPPGRTAGSRFTTLSDAEFRKPCEALGAPTMANDARFQTIKKRLKNVEAPERELGTLTATFERDELVPKLRARELPQLRF